MKNKILSIFKETKKIKNVYEYCTSPRGSSLPTCRLDLLMHHYSKINGDLPTTLATMQQDFYLIVGNALHDLYQKWLGYTGRSYADWTCHNCGMVIRGFGPYHCHHCDLAMTPEELEVHDRGFSGHIDLILNVSEDINVIELYVVDFKFLTHSDKDLVWTYVLQVMSYAVILRRMGLPIKGAMVWYADRSDPLNLDKIHLHEVDICEEIYETFIEEIQAYNNAIKNKTSLDQIPGICANEKDVTDMGCMWSKICGSPVRDKLLSSFINKNNC